MDKTYVQYGCGLSAPEEWVNFDVSPTLRIQKIPIIGSILKPKLNVVFPSNVKYGNIIKGLPIKDNSCDGVYCSHTLEHLSLNDCRKALRNTFKLLKPGGTFRCVLPDLEYAVNMYMNDLKDKKTDGSINFLKNNDLGVVDRKTGIKGIIKYLFSNYAHLWMWDQYSLKKELEDAGFVHVRVCKFGDHKDDMFSYVENEDRFINSLALEGFKEK